MTKQLKSFFGEIYFFVEKKVLKVGSRAGSASGSVIHSNGAADPDPYQNYTDPQHCLIHPEMYFVKVPVHVAERAYLRDGRGAGRRSSSHHHAGATKEGGQTGEWMGWT